MPWYIVVERYSVYFLEMMAKVVLFLALGIMAASSVPSPGIQESPNEAERTGRGNEEAQATRAVGKIIQEQAGDRIMSMSECLSFECDEESLLRALTKSECLYHCAYNVGYEDAYGGHC